MRKTERQPQQAKKPSARPIKSAGLKSSTTGKKRTIKVPDGKAKNSTKIEQNIESSPKLQVDTDPLASYQKELENFQEYMEHKLGQIMTSDKIQKVDADRILKKFHSAMAEERRAMKKIAKAYGSQTQLNSLVDVGPAEENEEDRRIEAEFKALDDAIKEESKSLDQKEQSISEDDKEEDQEIKQKIKKKKKILKLTRGKPGKSNTANPRPRAMNENYKTQTDSTRRKDSTKPEVATKGMKKEESSFVKKNEYASKLRNMSREISLENRQNFQKNEKLMKILKVPTTDESSDSDLLLNGVTRPKQKIETKKSKAPARRKKEDSSFENPKSVAGKERHEVLMNLLGQNNLRKTYMKVIKQGEKKTPIFR